MRLRGRGRLQGPLGDRVTTGLAALAVGTAGTVIAGEVLKLARRRFRAQPRGDSFVEGLGRAATLAGQGAVDTLTVAREGYTAAPHHERVMINMLTGFTGAFALARFSATGIRGGWWPLGNVVVGGRHIHHFVPGIVLAFGSAIAALVTDDNKLERYFAVPFGAGAGLTLDEAALLLDLRDVYWSREGILSVQVSLGVAATIGAAIISLRMLGRGERRATDSGVLPALDHFGAGGTTPPPISP